MIDKTCSVCNKSKPLAKFYKVSPTRYRGDCMDCHIARVKLNRDSKCKFCDAKMGLIDGVWFCNNCAEICPECDGKGMCRYPFPSRLDPECEAEWDTCHTCNGKMVIEDKA